MGENAQFSLDVKAFVEATKQDMLYVVKDAMINISKDVITMSPVDSGRFRSNWQVGEDVAPSEPFPEQDAYPSGAETLERVQREITSISAKVRDIYLANCVPYAYRLEMEGWSQQAPAGMLRVVVPEFQTYLDKAAREIRNR